MNVLSILLSINLLIEVSFNGDIAGRIKSSDGNPIPNVNIILLNTPYGASSNFEGNFVLKNVPAGKYILRASAIGYNSKEIEVIVKDKEVLKLDIELQQSTIYFPSVTIKASRIQSQEDTRTSLINVEPRSIKILPGASEDLFRTLQALPGVNAINDFSSQLVIRGSGPDQNLIVFDDVEVFNPYRLYGAISMFNPETVNDINLITGGFPARYGDRLSAVLDVNHKDGNQTLPLSGNINVNLSNANFVMEGKLPYGLNGSWIFNSRRTYYDLIVEPFVKKTGLIKGDVAFPNFYDFQFKTSFYPKKRNKISVLTVYSRDAVNLVTDGKRTTPDSIGVNDKSFNNIYALSYQYNSQNFTNKFISSYYINRGITFFDSKFLDPSLNRKEFENGFSDSLYQFLLGFSFNSIYEFTKYSFEDRMIFYSGKNSLELGIGVDFMNTEIKYEFLLDPQLKAILNSFSSFRSIVDKFGSKITYWRFKTYSQANYSLTSDQKIFLSPGIRFDYYDVLRKYYIAPRLGISYALNDLTTLRAVYGIYYQSPGYEKIRDQNVLFDLSRTHTKDLKAERADHYILSFERYLTQEWQFKTEMYYKDFKNLIVPLKVRGVQFKTEPIPGRDIRYVSAWTKPIPIPADSATNIPINNSTGYSYGLEILLSKINKSRISRLDGWIAYTLSYSTREENGRKIPFRFEQRHTFNLVLNYTPYDWLEIGIRWQYGSGLPYTKPVGIKPRIIVKDIDGDGIQETPEIAYRQNLFNPNAPKEVIFNVDYGVDPNFYNERKPDYHRLDLRVSYYTSFWNLNWLFYLDIINLYNHKNVVGYDYYIDKNLELQRRETYMLPIFPTLGISLRF